MVNVTDMTGREIPASFRPNGNDLLLDLSNARPGSYLLYIDGRVSKVARE